MTDIVGFSLMVPSVRAYLARKLIARGSFSTSTFYSNVSNSYQTHNQQGGRTIDGEFEENDKAGEGDKFEENSQETKRVDKS